MSSDESEFYGDSSLVAELEKKVDDLDVEKWWKDHGTLEAPMRTQVRGEPSSTSRFHNPRAGDTHAWQLTETIDEFLRRIPPATTDVTPGHSWIWICNPYIKRKSMHEAENQHVRGGEDEAPEEEGADIKTLIQAGEERLQFASSFIDQFRTPGQSSADVAREAGKAGMDAAKDILALAKSLRVTCGKWMLFCTAYEVNDVWEIIAKATANNELGIGAKVAARSNMELRTTRLICVYTTDFSDKKDVARVARRLKQLRLVKGKPLFYKPGQLTAPMSPVFLALTL
ncbi:hypothetical protein F4802DRAFT_246655 [Xylaria palmicola]|nr:hypothetical protein F4802DRAFT_246655 [Xylaria palmicola]